MVEVEETLEIDSVDLVEDHIGEEEVVVVVGDLTGFKLMWSHSMALMSPKTNCGLTGCIIAPYTDFVVSIVTCTYAREYE